MKQLLQFDYTAVGHVSVDVLDDGTRRPGGTAFYAALQAARLGQRTLILTQGVADEIEDLLEPYKAEFELRVLRARQTTELRTSGWGPGRAQRVIAWAGPIETELALDTKILHLAPVARELPERWRAPGAFVGLTPQGAMREWTAGGKVSLIAPTRASERVAARCDALVLSAHESLPGETLIERALDGGALVAITNGALPSTVLRAAGEESLEVEVPAVAEPVDDLGAGDVFAAALFVALAAGIAAEGATAFATAAAAVRMQGSGAGAIGSRAAIEERLRAVAPRWR